MRMLDPHPAPTVRRHSCPSLTALDRHRIIHYDRNYKSSTTGFQAMNAEAPKDIAALLKEERTYDVVSPHVLASMSGLDFMQAMVDGKLPAPPITGTMGFLVTRVNKGYALAEAIPSFDYYNPIGSVHGGYAATLMDTVLGVSVHTMMEKGQGYTTLEFKISFIKAITKDTGPIRAEG